MVMLLVRIRLRLPRLLVGHLPRRGGTSLMVRVAQGVSDPQDHSRPLLSHHVALLDVVLDVDLPITLGGTAPGEA